MPDFDETGDIEAADVLSETEDVEATVALGSESDGLDTVADRGSRPAKQPLPVRPVLTDAAPSSGPARGPMTFTPFAEPERAAPPSAPQAPILASHIESLPSADAPGQPSAFSSISTFPPPTQRTRSVPPPTNSTLAARAAPARTKAPPWVLAYLGLCLTLTLIGLVVLYIEQRVLGGSGP